MKKKRHISGARKADEGAIKASLAVLEEREREIHIPPVIQFKDKCADLFASTPRVNKESAAFAAAESDEGRERDAFLATGQIVFI